MGFLNVWILIVVTILLLAGRRTCLFAVFGLRLSFRFRPYFYDVCVTVFMFALRVVYACGYGVWRFRVSVDFCV